MKKENGKIKLNIVPAPHKGEGMSTSKMMGLTLAALLFPALGGIYFFGARVIYLLAVCVLSSLAAEYIGLKLRREKFVPGTISSAAVTGVILALILPPGFALWAACIGSLFAVLIVKHVFGGLGKNIFNPALMGRAFLAAAFPLIITHYAISPRPLPAGLSLRRPADTVSQATPLNRVKFEDEKLDSSMYLPFFLGEKKGSAGETSGLLILMGLAVLIISGAADWRLPLSYFSSVVLFSGLLWAFSPGEFINPLFTLILGGVLLGGTYMATDPVTTPASPKGKFIFGIGAGLLTVLIRTFSGYPEGAMFGILLMNAAVPLIDRYTAPRIYGT